MFDIGIKRVAAIATRALTMLGWVFGNLFRFKAAGFWKLQLNLRIKYFRIFFSVCFSLRSSLTLYWAMFCYYKHSFLSFQFSAASPDHPPQAQLQIRPWNQSISPQHQTISWERSSDHYIRIPQKTIVTTRPPNQTIRSDHQRQGQTTRSEHPPENRTTSLTTQLPISTTYPASWNGTGQLHSLWFGSRGVYRALDEPCKTYFPHVRPEVSGLFFGLT